MIFRLLKDDSEAVALLIPPGNVEALRGWVVISEDSRGKAGIDVGSTEELEQQLLYLTEEE